MLEALKNRLGLFPDNPNGTNGNGRRDPEAKGVALSLDPSIQFFSPDRFRTISRYFGGALTDTDHVTAQTAYAAAAYAYIAIRYRMRKISEAPLAVVREDQTTGQEEWLPDHPLAFLLEDPSPDFDMRRLVQRTVAYLDITGSALWVKDTARGGVPGRLTPFSGDEFTVEAAGGRIYGSFRLTNTQQGRPDREPEEVVLFQEVNPGDWHRGLAKLDVALSTLNLGQAAHAATKDILRNALTPSVIVQADPNWKPDDDEWGQFRAAIESHAARDRKGGPLVLTGGGNATRVSLSLRDVVPTDILHHVESVVAATFGIPAVVLQYEVGMENAPWSQMAEARRMAYEDTIQPEWRDMESALTRQLLWAPTVPGGRPVESDRRRFIRFDTTQIRALQKDVALMSDVAVKQAQIASLNERRMLVGLEPVDDPAADEIPELRQPEAPPEGEGFENPFGEPPPVDEEEEDEEAGRLPGLERKDRKAAVWERFDRETKDATDAWEAPVAEELAVQGAAIARLAERHMKLGRPEMETKEVSEDDAEVFLAALDEWMKARGVPRLRAITYPLVLRTSQAGVRAVAGQVGLSFQVLAQGLADYAATETAFLAEKMGETTGRMVADLVQAGIDEGDTVRKLAARLRTSAAFSRDRAQLVARTETTRAWNGAQRRSVEDYAERSGTGATKTWLSAQDDRVRPEHADLDGETRPVDARFSNGLTEPGEPNCRCTLLFDLEA